MCYDEQPLLPSQGFYWRSLFWAEASWVETLPGELGEIAYRND